MSSEKVTLGLSGAVLSIPETVSVVVVPLAFPTLSTAFSEKLTPLSGISTE